VGGWFVWIAETRRDLGGGRVDLVVRSLRGCLLLSPLPPRRDVYRLLGRVAQQYHGSLQVVAVDNELSRRILLEFAEYAILTLTQADRLIRIPATADTSGQQT